MLASRPPVAAKVEGYWYLRAEHNPGGVMAATLKRLGPLEVVPSPGESKFVRPETIYYHLDGAYQTQHSPCLVCSGYHEAAVAGWHAQGWMGACVGPR